jgi:hypothetical protein
MGQDNPGVLQDWLGSTNRARAESIAKKSRITVKKLGFQSKLTNRDKTGTVRGQNGDTRGHLNDVFGCFDVSKISSQPGTGEKKPL